MTTDMPRLAIVIGAILAALGVASYLGTGQVSLTALIPVPFGAVLALLGVMARKAASPKNAMHAAAVVALLGVLGSANGLPDLIGLLSGGSAERPLAVIAKSAMAILLAVFLAFCIRSFRQARRASQ